MRFSPHRGIGAALLVAPVMGCAQLVGADFGGWGSGASDAADRGAASLDAANDGASTIDPRDAGDPRGNGDGASSEGAGREGAVDDEGGDPLHDGSADDASDTESGAVHDGSAESGAVHDGSAEAGAVHDGSAEREGGRPDAGPTAQLVGSFVAGWAGAGAGSKIRLEGPRSSPLTVRGKTRSGISVEGRIE